MRFPIVAAWVLLVCACAHRTRESSPVRHDPDMISAEELDSLSVSVSTVYDAVQRLRPAWILRVRPNPALPNRDVIIYIDGNRYAAGIASLRTISLHGAFSVQFFTPTSAEARFGPGHLLGAIEVLMLPH